MIVADWGATGQNPSKVATSGTAAVYFPRLQFQALRNGDAGGPTGFPGLQAPATPTASSAQGQLYLPGSQYFSAANGTRLRAIASGAVFTGASSTVTVTIQANTGTLSSPSYTTLATTGAATAFSGRASFMLECHFVIAGSSSVATDKGTGLQLNSGSPAPLVQGQLTGAYMGMINQALFPSQAAAGWVASAATTNDWNWLTSGLVVNITFGTGNANNVATLNEFSVLGD
jgi:hypothetical protein